MIAPAVIEFIFGYMAIYSKSAIIAIIIPRIDKNA
jgi:hypothetical protein